MLGLSIASTQIPSGLFANSQFAPAFENSSQEFNSSFNPVTGEWEVEWPGKVAQYDLVYKSPPLDAMQGIPLGNGDMGLLFWCEETKIIIAVNKSDLWHDASFETFQNWSKEQEDYSTTLRHACRIVIDFNCPVFSTLFLTDFNARLHIADGSMRLYCATPFGSFELKAFVEYSTGMIFLDLQTNFKEETNSIIYVERFGSRTFSHWYSQINRDATIGTTGTATTSDGSGIYITQELKDVSFAVGASVINQQASPVNYVRENSRQGSISVGKKKVAEIKLALKVTSPGEGGMIESLKKELAAAKEKGIDSFLATNAASWKLLWSRSFMDYGDVYLTNLWYLTIYYAITSQGGKYPGRFNNGMWSWSRDVQNWNFYFHWNQQQLYWPLNAAGYHELVDPYLDFRFRSLPHARNDARKHFDSDGAFISDVAERRGFNSEHELINHTPVAEIALDFWRQYQYTGDKQFLREKALPFIMEAAKFFDSLFIKETDGLYHAREGSGYEGWIRLRDGLTELVYARVLFTVALAALKAADTDIPESEKWKEILGNLAPIPLVKAGSESIEQRGSAYQLNTGYFKGYSVSTDKITAAGWGIKEGEWLTVYHTMKEGPYFGLKLLDGIFPTVASSAVFPSNYIGLADRDNGNAFFEPVKSTSLLYSPGITGWDPVPVVLARLGLTEELAKVLQVFPERWQIYCNGWGHWGLEGEINKDAEWFFRTNNVRDATSADEKRFPIRMWPFRHMSMESMSVFATAMNESLLQSHDGVIRVIPAFNKSCRFMLHAVGGFVVSAQAKQGKVEWICIKSSLGNDCTVQSPWSKPVLFIKGKKVKYTSDGKLLKFKTKPGEIIFVLPEGSRMEDWKNMQEQAKENDKERVHSSGKAQLGLPRMF